MRGKGPQPPRCDGPAAAHLTSTAIARAPISLHLIAG